MVNKIKAVWLRHLTFCMIRAWFLLMSLMKISSVIRLSIHELLRYEISSIYPGVDPNPVENINGSCSLLEFYKRCHLSNITIASDMRLVPNERATLILHFCIRFDSPAVNSPKVVNLKVEK